MSEYAFNKSEELWSELHDLIKEKLSKEDDYTADYVAVYLHENFKFLYHQPTWRPKR